MSCFNIDKQHRSDQAASHAAPRHLRQVSPWLAKLLRCPTVARLDAHPTRYTVCVFVLMTGEMSFSINFLSYKCFRNDLVTCKTPFYVILCRVLCWCHTCLFLNLLHVYGKNTLYVIMYWLLLVKKPLLVEVIDIIFNICTKLCTTLQLLLWYPWWRVLKCLHISIHAMSGVLHILCDKYKWYVFCTCVCVCACLLISVGWLGPLPMFLNVDVSFIY